MLTRCYEVDLFIEAFMTFGESIIVWNIENASGAIFFITVTQWFELNPLIPWGQLTTWHRAPWRELVTVDDMGMVQHEFHH